MGSRNITSDNLDYFYKHIFPAEQIFAWTQHGSNDPKENSKREYSITLSNEQNKDGVFVRYNACLTSQRFRQLLTSRVSGTGDISWVSKLDIGPKFDGDVSRHKEKALKPEEKELVFDIDMDEYNSVRTCCQDKKVCPACFAFLSAAAKILHHQLSETFGFKHILFVFSGRRGIHCWISDYEARILTSKQREGLASYLHSGLQENKKQIASILDHPVLSQAYDILKADFIKLFKTQDFFKTALQRTALINAYFDKPSAIIEYNKGRKTDGSPEQEWENLQAQAKSEAQMSGIYRIVLDYLYPRLDIEVSKQFNHLLKSPFCVHPATDKICVPIPLEEIESFNPDHAPLLQTVIAEHKDAISRGKQLPQFTMGSELPKYISPVPLTGVLATSLGKYVEFFTEFVANVVKDEIQRRALDDDLEQAINGNW